MDNYNNEFLDKVAIVTGAGQGMGKAVATRLAQSGSKIVVFDINQEQANSTVNSLNELKCESLVVTGDVTQKKDVDGAVSVAIDEFGKIDILINNAGISGGHVFF